MSDTIEQDVKAKELQDLESLLLRLTKTIRKSIPKKGKTGGIPNKRWRKKLKAVESKLKGKIKQKSPEPSQELASPNPIE